MSETTVLLEGIDQWDYQETHRQISMLGEVAKVTPAQLLKVLECLPLLIERHSGTWAVTFGKDTFSGYKFEGLLWALGESMRRMLKRDRALRRSSELWTRVENICADHRFGKGRESFTMLLGQYGGRARVPTLLRLLEDSQLQGHALYALRLAGGAEARAKAEELLASPQSWIRAEARKYLRKCDK